MSESGPKMVGAVCRAKGQSRCKESMEVNDAASLTAKSGRKDELLSSVELSECDECTISTAKRET